jgi:outer membrane protein TolC
MQPQSTYDPALRQGPPVIANDFEITQPQHSLSRMTDPFADPSASSSSGSIAALPSQPAMPPAPAPSPSLADLRAPEPSPGQSQNVLEAGHAGADNRVIQAFAESVTPRNYVTVGQWAGPLNRPVQSIQRVSFDACADCEDVQRVPAESLINPYTARANGYPTSVALPHEAGQLAELPREYAPWWDEVINKPMRAAPSTRPVNVESLIFEAIQHSPQITAFRIDPIIRETQILEEAAAFDWQTFLETKFDDSNDPIGNSLTTGDNSDRFTDKQFTSRIGVEKRLEQGGSLDATQKFGLQDNNSTFFTPRDQGTSRLELNFTQPLLRGAGQTYNESRTVLAMLDHQISEDDLQESLQDHLVEVYTTYWSLYRARAVRLQKERLLRRAIDVEQKLAARQGIDAVRRQVLRARAAIASRRSEIVRADMEVRNAESRLRLLVNSPGLKHSTIVELLPVEAPMSDYMNVSMRGSVETALQNRPDIQRAIKQMKETAVRLEVSKNELLPKLDLVLGTYVAGLRGRSQVDTAWTNQFRDGRPGYTVGLMLQYPLGNREAKARYAKREWEVAKTLKEFEASVEASMSEVELAVREFETSYQEMLSRFQSMIAADTEANYLLERWRLLPGNDQTTSFLLEDLLDSQERVAMEEQDFVEAQVAYVLSVVRLKRASGILLSCDCGNSPVSFMTPAARRIAQPKPLPRPVGQRPALPAPIPANAKLTPPLPALPRTQTSAGPQGRMPQSTETSLSQPSIIPMPGPAPLPVPARSQL